MTLAAADVAACAAALPAAGQCDILGVGLDQDHQQFRDAVGDRWLSALQHGRVVVQGQGEAAAAGSCAYDRKDDVADAFGGQVLFDVLDQPHYQADGIRITFSASSGRLESVVGDEITDHLGYDKHDPSGRNDGNSRNGKRSKTVLTDVWLLEIVVPRYRDGSQKLLKWKVVGNRMWRAASPLTDRSAWRAMRSGL
ncbi:transposase [Streptomyces mutabilis]|uniref:transposase n=1 Tax=Streptomyces TaxID=1883 RepID=UPI003697C98C